MRTPRRWNGRIISLAAGMCANTPGGATRNCAFIWRRLQELEYLLVHHGGRGQSFVYELVFERSANDEKPVLSGLIDVEKLKMCRYDEKNAGLNGGFAGSKRPQSGGIAGGCAVSRSQSVTSLSERFGPFCGKNTDTGPREKEPVVIIAAGGR